MMTVNFIVNIWCNFAIFRQTNLNWVAAVCPCLSPSLMFIWLCVDWVSFVLVLLSESPLLCQLLEESRPLLETCKVKDSTVVAGNKQVNTPDTDTSLELIKDLREYFGSHMPQNKWYKEKGALIYRQPTFKWVMKIFYSFWLDILKFLSDSWNSKHQTLYLYRMCLSLVRIIYLSDLWTGFYLFNYLQN